jgi:RNA methyltransferase, TrmH family
MNQKEIKKIASLAHTKYRRQYGLFFVEGLHLVAEFLKSDWQAESLVVAEKESYSNEMRSIIKEASNRNILINTVDQAIFEKLSTTETPQGIMAIVQIPPTSLKQVLSKKRIIVADGISDPGNMGTIIRTAAAFGFDGLITTPGSVDIYSPKVVRATQGAMFRTTFAEHVAPAVIIDKLKSYHTIYALSPYKGVDIASVDVSTQSALVIGAEIAGVNNAFLKAADFTVRIPMSGTVESLNAAVAAGIAMFEFSRID